MTYLTAVWTIVAIASSASAQLQTRVVALTGQQAAGAEPGVVYSLMATSPVIGQGGHVAFQATLAGVGVNNDNRNGVWTAFGGSIQLAAREGLQAVGTSSGVVYDFFDSGMAVGASGTAAFEGFLRGTGVNNDNHRGIWAIDNGTTRAVVRNGEQAPGLLAGARFTSHSDPSVTSDGRVAFVGTTRGGILPNDTNRGVWIEDAGAIRLDLLADQQAPGLPTGVLIGLPRTPGIGSTGHLTFYSSLSGPSVHSGNNASLFSHVDGNLRLVVREGDQAPGLPAGVIFNDFASPGFNARGDIAFTSSVRGTDVTLSNESTLWKHSGNSLRLLGREGDQVPELDPGVVFTLFNQPVINQNGRVALSARIGGPGVTNDTDDGIWYERGGDLRLLVRAGDQAVGTDPDVRFRSLGDLSINAFGQVVFLANLIGPGVTQGNDLGIWGTDRAGLLHSVLRLGQVIDVNDDPLIQDLRIVQGFSTVLESGGQDGVGSSFNDRGELVVSASFTDGTSAVLVVSVPAPGAVTLLGAACIGLVWRRRAITVRPRR